MQQGFDIPNRIEEMYRRAIRRILIPEFHRKPEEQSYTDWLREIASISERRDVADAAAYIAGQMVNWVNVKNAQTWREAAMRAQRGQMIYRLLQRELRGVIGDRVRDLVRENATLITRIPNEIAERLTADIAKAQQAGERPEAIEKYMRTMFPRMTKNRIRLIARTESMKASTALTQARSEELELPAYVWMTSHDSRVRDSHRNMDGVIVLWRDPPSPEALIGERSTLGHYHVGDCPNCRCTPIVILTLDDVQFPARVYSYGRIKYMMMDEFSRLTRIRERRAA
jgi:SPP1 gp7 family putative phage head morphogenesis protein